MFLKIRDDPCRSRDWLAGVFFGWVSREGPGNVLCLARAGRVEHALAAFEGHVCHAEDLVSLGGGWG